MQKIKTSGAEVSFQTYTPTDQDLGTWVTLINGYMRPQTDFKQMARAFTKGGYHVLTLDNRGVGGTEITRPFSLQDMVNDVVQIWDSLGVDGSCLIGVSMGGVISQILAHQNLGRISSLCLVSTLQERGFFKNASETLPESFPEMMEYLSAYVAPTFFSRNKLLLEAMAKQMLAKNKDGGDLKTNLNGSKEQRTALKQWEPLSEEEIKKWPESLKVSIFHGSEDAIIDVESAFSMHQAFRGSDLKIYGGTGHLLIAEKSKVFYRDLLAALIS